jgi:hypothetical protein
MTIPLQAMPVTLQDEDDGVETTRRNPANPMKDQELTAPQPGPNPSSLELGQVVYSIFA